MRELRHLVHSLRYPALWALLVLAGVLSAVSAQAPFRYDLLVAQFRADPYLLNWHGTQFIEGRDARWSHNYSYVRFAGTGGNRPIQVTVHFNPYRSDVPDTDPVQVRGFVGGEELYVQTFPAGSGWQRMVMDVDASHPQAFAARDVVIELRSDTYRSRENPGKDLGVAVGQVTVEPLEGTPAGFVVPNIRAVALSVALPFALYLLLARAGGALPLITRRRTAFLVAMAATGVLAWASALHITEVGIALPHLITTLAGGYILLVVADFILPRLFRGTSRTHLAYVSVALALAFILRFGISGLPQTNVVDLPYHLKWLRILLNGGFMELYLPGELSSVPPEWGLDVLIPKSPLFYIALWPLGIIPGVDLPYAMVLVVSLMDALAVLGIYALVRRVSTGGALMSALLYAVMPLSFRAFIYGILPTIFAQVLTLLVMLIPTLWPAKLTRPLPLLGWSVLLALSLIAFPTALAFNSFMVVALGAGWVWRRAASRRVFVAMLVGLVEAIALSFVLYYGLYVEPFVTRTLPALQSGVNIGGKELWPNGVPDLLDWTARYAIGWALWLVIPVGLLLLWRSRSEAGRRLSVLMLAWLLLFVGGMVVNLRIDMIGKHIYYTLPAAAVAGGLLLAHLWRRPLGGFASRALVALVGLHLVWAALLFVAGRL